MQGELTVITGPMGSGKTDVLISKLTGLQAVGYSVKAFKPIQDTRSPTGYIKSRSGVSFPCMDISNVTDILLYADADVVGISEVMMFPSSILYVVDCLIAREITIIMEGLNQNAKGESFGEIGNLLAMADHIDLRKANCMKCKRIGGATKTYRLTKDTATILVGDLGIEYLSVCPSCWKTLNF